MDPFTITMATMAIGNLFSGLFGASAARSRAKAEEAAAHQALAEAGVQSQNAILHGDAVEANAATQVAANGGGFVGSSMGVIDQLARQSMFNARVANYRGQTEAQAHMYNAKVDKQDATNQMIGAALSTVAPIVSGAVEKSSQTRAMNSLQTLHGQGQDSLSDYNGMQ